MCVRLGRKTLGIAFKATFRPARRDFKETGGDRANTLQLIRSEFQLQSEKPASFNSPQAETLSVRRVQSSQHKKGLIDVLQATLQSVMDGSHGSGYDAGRVHPPVQHGTWTIRGSNSDLALSAGQ